MAVMSASRFVVESLGLSAVMVMFYGWSLVMTALHG